jgi:hypothetical protein
MQIRTRGRGRRAPDFATFSWRLDRSGGSVPGHVSYVSQESLSSLPAVGYCRCATSQGLNENR